MFYSVTLKLLYGGTFFVVGTGRGHYSGRFCMTIVVDKDEFCYFTLIKEAERCGNFNRDVDRLYYLNPTTGMQVVENDKDALKMCEMCVRDKNVYGYIIMGRDEGEVSTLIEELSQSQVDAVSSKLVPIKKQQGVKVANNEKKSEGVPATFIKITPPPKKNT